MYVYSGKISRNMFIGHACSLHVINHRLISRMNIMARLDGFKWLSLWHCREDGSGSHDNCDYQELNALYNILPPSHTNDLI